LREAIDGEAVSKGPSQAGGRLSGEAGVVLLRPRLLPLPAEQQLEAVALLSELLLAAAQRSAEGRDVPADGAEAAPSRRRFAAGELCRRRLAARAFYATLAVAFSMAFSASR
jgi:hypothetical protein